MSANASVSPADAETGGRLCPLLAHSVNSDSYLEWSLSEA